MNRKSIKQMNWEDSRPHIQKAVATFLKRDENLLQNNAYEVSVSHRIALYLEKSLGPSLLAGRAIDCDYNRTLIDKYGDKDIELPNMEDSLSKLEKLVSNSYKLLYPRANKLASNVQQVRNNLPEHTSARPDIILHERGNNKRNSLLIEIKVAGHGGVPAVITDCARLLLFTDTTLNAMKLPTYDFGLFLDLRWNKKKRAHVFAALLFSRGKVAVVDRKTFLPV